MVLEIHCWRSTLTYCNSPVRNVSAELTATFLGSHPGAAAEAADRSLRRLLADVRCAVPTALWG